MILPSGRTYGFGYDPKGNRPSISMPSASCGGSLRPGVVWFGEMLPPEASDAAAEMLSRCEVLIVAGTSAVVAPASGYAALAKRHARA